MEIITNLRYNEKQHTLHPFLRDHFKTPIFPMVSHKAVGKIMNGRNMIQSMEALMKLDWRTMRQSRPTSTGQRTNIVLGDNTNVSVCLLQSAAKDKMVMMVTGDDKEIQFMVIAYTGCEDTFNQYLEELGVSELECYANLIHLEEVSEEQDNA